MMGRVGIGADDIRKVESSSRPGIFYELRRHPDGNWSCTCLGYEHREVCKHTRRMVRDDTEKMLRAEEQQLLAEIFQCRERLETIDKIIKKLQVEKDLWTAGACAAIPRLPLMWRPTRRAAARSRWPTGPTRTAC